MFAYARDDRGAQRGFLSDIGARRCRDAHDAYAAAPRYADGARPVRPTVCDGGAGVREYSLQQAVGSLHVARPRERERPVAAVLSGAQHRKVGASWVWIIAAGVTCPIFRAYLAPFQLVKLHLITEAKIQRFRRGKLVRKMGGKEFFYSVNV